MVLLGNARIVGGKTDSAINRPVSQEGPYLRYASALVTAEYAEHASGIASLDLDFFRNRLKNAAQQS